MASHNRAGISICISKECDEIIRKNFGYGEFGKWVEKLVFNSFSNAINEEKLTKEVKETEIKLITLQNQLKEIKETSEKERYFILSAKEKLDRSWSFMGGIIGEYSNKFGKRVTEQYIKDRIEGLKQKKEGKPK